MLGNLEIGIAHKERQKINIKKAKKEGKESSFLSDLRKNTLGSRKILVFFIGFSAFCFSSMTQMSMSIDDLASENFSWMMILIGMILAFMTLLMSLTSVVKANIKTIAMMKVFGYSQKECSRSIFGGYRPVSYIGFFLFFCSVLNILQLYDRIVSIYSMSSDIFLLHSSIMLLRDCLPIFLE